MRKVKFLALSAAALVGGSLFQLGCLDFGLFNAYLNNPAVRAFFLWLNEDVFG